MKITMYTLHGMWHSNYTDESVVVDISTDEAQMIKKLDKIANNKGRNYLEMCGCIQEKRDEKNYEAFNGCGKHIEFHITEHQVELAEMVMGNISHEMEKINHASDVEAYLKNLYESESIAPWKYEYMMRRLETMQEILFLLDKEEDCNIPYNATLGHAIETVMNKLTLDDEKLKFLWKEFEEDVMIDEEGDIMCDFIGFESSTPQTEVYHWFDKWYSGGIAKLMYPDMEPLNTKLFYVYRDDYNYEQVNRIVIPGTFTMEQIDTIIDCLDKGRYFIPEQVGFPAVRTENPIGKNGLLMKLNWDGFTPSSEKPDTAMTPDEVVAKFLEAKGKWDESKAQ